MMKTQIKAEIVADSINQQGDRLTSLLITFPRIILAEVNTHRMLSKNTSSSRAIPFKKMVESVQNDPFIPIAWQKHHSGMQGSEYISTEEGIHICKRSWLEARDTAIIQAQWLNSCNVTKQLCNRLLEPFMWTTMLITGSKEGWDNFFELRCPQYEGPYTDVYKSKIDFIKGTDEPDMIPKTDLSWLRINKGQAEIHIMDLAEKIFDAMNESEPKQLEAGEWHIPFENKIRSNVLDWSDDIEVQVDLWGKDLSLNKVKVSTAMAARTSYTVVGDEKEIDYEKMINLHDRLIEMRHDSPLEHCARAMSDEEYETFIKGRIIDVGCEKETYEDGYECSMQFTNNVQGWCRNFKGFIQYRHIIENNKYE